jgi:hypothetical protein
VSDRKRLFIGVGGIALLIVATAALSIHVSGTTHGGVPVACERSLQAAFPGYLPPAERHETDRLVACRDAATPFVLAGGVIGVAAVVMLVSTLGRSVDRAQVVQGERGEQRRLAALLGHEHDEFTDPGELVPQDRPLGRVQGPDSAALEHQTADEPLEPRELRSGDYDQPLSGVSSAQGLSAQDRPRERRGSGGSVDRRRGLSIRGRAIVLSEFCLLVIAAVIVWWWKTSRRKSA